MIVDLEHRDWTAAPAPDLQARAAAAIEEGAVLHLPSLPFALSDAEQRLFDIALGRSAKNISYSPVTDRLAGAEAHGDDAEVLRGAIARFSGSAVAIARGLLPAYAARLNVARASFRPAEIAGRVSSWRKDDTRLHVDSFPSSPTGGRRILRVFSNVNPNGRPRTWRLGPPFVDIVALYRSDLRMPWPGKAALLHALRITKSHRPPYDDLMLQLHDRMKADEQFQTAPGYETIPFAPGATWLCFTDEVAHAAMSGQYQFEQTLLLPVDAMRDESRAPLRILERAMGRTLT